MRGCLVDDNENTQKPTHTTPSLTMRYGEVGGGGHNQGTGTQHTSRSRVPRRKLSRDECVGRRGRIGLRRAGKEGASEEDAVGVT